MSWQEDLKQLDDELSSGKIGIEEHRKRRDDLLASASSAASAGVGHTPVRTREPDQEPQPAQATEQAVPETAGTDAERQHAGSAPESKAPESEAPASPAPAAQPAAGQQPATAAEQVSAQQTTGHIQPVQPPTEDADRTATVAASQVAAAQAAAVRNAAQNAATQNGGTPQTGRAQAPPESPAERTQWVTQNPTQARTPAPPQPMPPHSTPAPWQREVPKFPPRPEPAQQPPHPGPYSMPPGPPPYGQPPSPPHGTPRQGPPGQWSPQQPPPPANAGQGWQPQWSREWEPAPGGGPFDAFDTSPPQAGEDKFEQQPKKTRPTGKIVAIALAAVLVLAIAGLGVWWFLLRSDGTTTADGGGQPGPVPTNIDGMLAAIPQLPGQPNNEVGPTIPTSSGPDQGLYPVSTAESLIGEGTNNVVYKASVNGDLQYGVLAVPSERPAKVSEEILNEQLANGWQRSEQAGTPDTGTALTSNKGGVTFHRVLYNTGKWTIFVGVSPDQPGDDAQIRKDFGAVVQSVSKALPPS